MFRGIEVPPGFKDAVAAAAAAGASSNTSTIRCKSGNECLIEWRNTCLPDGAGGILGFLSIGIDITEQAQIDQAYQSLVDNSLLSLAILQDQRIVFVNKAFEQMTGYTESALLSLPPEKLIEIVHPDDRKLVWKRYFDRLEAKSPPERYQWRFIRKDGQIRWVETHASLIDYNGRSATQTAHLDITESREQRLELETERDRAQRYLDIARTILIVLDANGIVEQINQAGCDVICLDAEDIVGCDWFCTFIPEADREQKKTDYLRLMKGELPSDEHYESIVLSHGRGERLIAWNSSLLRDDAGNLTGTLSSGEDITERRHIENDLRESEARFRSLVESSQDGIVLLDWRGMVTEWNQGQERIVGLKKQDVLLKPLWNIVPQVLPEEKKASFQAQQIQSGVLALLRGESPDWMNSPSPIEIERPDGERRIIESSVFAIKRGDHAQLGSITRDVTQRERAGEKLAASEMMFRSIYENAAVGMAIGRTPLPLAARRHLEANDALLRMVGYERGEIGSIWNIVHPEDVEEQRARFEALVGRREGSYQSEMRFVRKDGQIIWSRITVSSSLSEDAQSLFISIIVEDITSQRLAQDALQTSASELRALGVRLAKAQEAERKRIARELHDQVSQNLTALSINITTMEKKSESLDAKTRERLIDSLELIEETAARIRDLTFELRPPVLDDFGLMAALRWHGERIAAQSGLIIHVIGDEPSPRLHPQSEMALFRVAQESITNVIKHANAHNVTIAVTSDAEIVRLAIEDDGVGFDSSATKRHDEPSWGLINMRERIESLGGAFTIESIAGEGAHITIEISR